MKLVLWLLMGGLLHLVQGGWDLVGSPLRCSECNSLPINGQCDNHHIAV